MGTIAVRKVTLSVTITLPTREITNALVAWLVTATITVRRFRLVCFENTAISGERAILELDRRRQDNRSDCHCNAMFAGTLKLTVCGALAGSWHAIVYSDDVLMVFWMQIAPIANADIAVNKGEFECFVLRSFRNSGRKF